MNHVLYFTADWCNPCKKVKPIVEDLNREQINAKFFIINVDTELEMVEDFEVQTVPTFILISNNVEIARVSGAKTRKELENFINYEKNT
jgi:thioredoxin 1